MNRHGLGTDLGSGEGVVRVMLGDDAEANSDTLDAAIRSLYLYPLNIGACVQLEPGEFPLARRMVLSSGRGVHFIRSLWVRGQGTTLVWEGDSCGVEVRCTNYLFSGGLSGLRLVRSPSSDLGVGLHFVGVAGFKVSDLSVEGFGTGILFETAVVRVVGRLDEKWEAPACAYNELHLREMRDNLVGLTFRTGYPRHDVEPWANRNKVYGGRWIGRDSPHSRHVVLTDNAGSNVFEWCCFDGTPKYAVEVAHAIMNGHYAYFNACTFEGSESGALFRVDDSPLEEAEAAYRLIHLRGGRLRGVHLLSFASDEDESETNERRPRFLVLGSSLPLLKTAQRKHLWGVWNEGEKWTSASYERLPPNNILSPL